MLHMDEIPRAGGDRVPLLNGVPPRPGKKKTDLEAQIADLGDVSGHTLVVTLPKNVSVDTMKCFKDRLKAALPDDIQVIVVTEGVTVEIGG